MCSERCGACCLATLSQHTSLQTVESSLQQWSACAGTQRQLKRAPSKKLKPPSQKGWGLADWSQYNRPWQVRPWLTAGGIASTAWLRVTTSPHCAPAHNVCSSPLRYHVDPEPSLHGMLTSMLMIHVQMYICILVTGALGMEAHDPGHGRLGFLLCGRGPHRAAYTGQAQEGQGMLVPC